MNQRWRERRESYRPKGEVIRTAEYDVVPMRGKDPAAIGFVTRHHYSASYPSGRFAFGLHRRGALVGIAAFSTPGHPAVLTNVFPGSPDDSTELGRFVLLDEVPGNGETWMLARCFELLRREGLAGVVSFSDPVARTDAAGRVVHPGHLGTIYQAHNAVFLGRARARVKRLYPDGTVAEERTLSKIPTRRKGWREAVERLVSYGAEPLGDAEPREWLRRQLPRVTRPLPHPGNFKYAWALHRAVRLVGERFPYPKELGWTG